MIESLWIGPDAHGFWAVSDDENSGWIKSNPEPGCHGESSIYSNLNFRPYRFTRKKIGLKLSGKGPCHLERDDHKMERDAFNAMCREFEEEALI